MNISISVSPEVWGGSRYITKTTSGLLFKEFAPKDSTVLKSEDISTIEKLYHDEFPKFPPQAYKNAYKHLTENPENISWEQCIPTKRYFKLLMEYANSIESYLQAHDLTYYYKYHERFRILLNERMLPAKINQTKLLAYLHDATDAQKAFLATFRPTDGYAARPEYNLTGTKTGRLTTISGPSILGLKKDYRNVLTSKFGDEGSIWILDYSALEPRVLLSLSGAQNIPQDIYLDIIGKLDLVDKIPRDIIKLVVISMLYGQLEHNTEEQVKEYTSKPGDLIQAVKDYFHTDAVVEKLSQELAINDSKYVTNYYGRLVACENTRASALLNYYVQSTSVCVALLGFAKIIDRIYDNDLQNIISPLFILHDAIFLDIHNDYQFIIPKLEKCGAIGIKGFETTNFYLQSKKLI